MVEVPNKLYKRSELRVEERRGRPPVVRNRAGAAVACYCDALPDRDLDGGRFSGCCWACALVREGGRADDGVVAEVGPGCWRVRLYGGELLVTVFLHGGALLAVTQRAGCSLVHYEFEEKFPGHTRRDFVRWVTRFVNSLADLEALPSATAHALEEELRRSF